LFCQRETSRVDKSKKQNNERNTNKQKQFYLSFQFFFCLLLLLHTIEKAKKKGRQDRKKPNTSGFDNKKGNKIIKVNKNIHVSLLSVVTVTFNPKHFKQL